MMRRGRVALRVATASCAMAASTWIAVSAQDGTTAPKPERGYLYFLARSTEGIDVVPLDPQHLNRFLAAPKRLFGFDSSHVWERYGEMNEYPDVSWIEGPWMLRHEGTYYLQYSASGTPVVPAG